MNKGELLEAVSSAPDGAHASVRLDSSYMTIGAWFRTDCRDVVTACGYIKRDGQHHVSFVPCEQHQPAWCAPSITLTRTYWRRGQMPKAALMGWLRHFEVTP